MFMDPSHSVISSKFPSSLEQESSWIANSVGVKELDAHESGETLRGGLQHLLPCQLSPSVNVHQSTNHQSDTNSLINEIGRDISINCLLRCSRQDYGSIALLNKSFQSLIRSGEIYRMRREMGIIEHWVYFSCGLLQWEAFDPLRNKWMTLPAMDLYGCFMYSDKESLAVGTHLLVFGKEINSHVVFKYCLLTHSWTPGAKTYRPRCLFGSASLGEMAIVAGGCNSRDNILSSAELYNSETETWVNLPNMNKARKLCSGVFLDGKFYVVGGVGVGSTSALTCGEVYNFATNTWRVIPNMYPVRLGRSGEIPAIAKSPPLLAVVKNELYAAYYDEDREVRKYEKGSNSWVTLGHLPENVSCMHGWGLAFRGCGDLLMVIGGSMGSYGRNVAIYTWEPDGGPPRWTLLVKKLLGNFVYNCAVMGC